MCFITPVFSNIWGSITKFLLAKIVLSVKAREVVSDLRGKPNWLLQESVPFCWCFLSFMWTHRLYKIIQVFLFLFFSFFLTFQWVTMAGLLWEDMWVIFKCLDLFDCGYVILFWMLIKLRTSWSHTVTHIMSQGTCYSKGGGGGSFLLLSFSVDYECSWLYLFGFSSSSWAEEPARIR